MRAGGGKRNHVRIDSLLVHDFYAVIDIAMSPHGNVVIAGIMQARVLLLVVANVDRARSVFYCLDVFGWIVVIVEVNDGHSFDSLGSLRTKSIRERPAEANPAPRRCLADSQRADSGRLPVTQR